MRKYTKTKIIILITLVILFALLPIITTNLSFIMGNSNKSSEYSDKINFDNQNLKFSIVSGKIHIDNNWSAVEAAGICTGNGTYSNPYVIEDLIIDGGGSGSCILIENSDVYFKIKNCTVYNSVGIKLYNVDNGQIINNNCTRGYTGIYLEKSNNNTISGNTVSNHKKGIFLIYHCDSNTISGNILNNHMEGIDLYWECCDNDILGNIINDTYTGIVLQVNSDRNWVSGNTLIVYGDCITNYGDIKEMWSKNHISNNSCVIRERDINGDSINPIPMLITFVAFLAILFGAAIIIYRKRK